MQAQRNVSGPIRQQEQQVSKQMHCYRKKELSYSFYVRDLLQVLSHNTVTQHHSNMLL